MMLGQTVALSLLLGASAHDCATEGAKHCFHSRPISGDEHNHLILNPYHHFDIHHHHHRDDDHDDDDSSNTEWDVPEPHWIDQSLDKIFNVKPEHFFECAASHSRNWNWFHMEVHKPGDLKVYVKPYLSGEGHDPDDAGIPHPAWNAGLEYAVFGPYHNFREMDHHCGTMDTHNLKTCSRHHWDDILPFGNVEDAIEGAQDLRDLGLIRQRKLQAKKAAEARSQKTPAKRALHSEESDLDLPEISENGISEDEEMDPSTVAAVKEMHGGLGPESEAADLEDQEPIDWEKWANDEWEAQGGLFTNRGGCDDDGCEIVIRNAERGKLYSVLIASDYFDSRLSVDLYNDMSGPSPLWGIHDGEPVPGRRDRKLAETPLAETPPTTLAKAMIAKKGQETKSRTADWRQALLEWFINKYQNRPPPGYANWEDARPTEQCWECAHFTDGASIEHLGSPMCMREEVKAPTDPTSPPGFTDLWSDKRAFYFYAALEDFGYDVYHRVPMDQEDWWQDVELPTNIWQYPGRPWTDDSPPPEELSWFNDRARKLGSLVSSAFPSSSAKDAKAKKELIEKAMKAAAAAKGADLAKGYTHSDPAKAAAVAKVAAAAKAAHAKAAAAKAANAKTDAKADAAPPKPKRQLNEKGHFVKRRLSDPDCPERRKLKDTPRGKRGLSECDDWDGEYHLKNDEYWTRTCRPADLSGLPPKQRGFDPMHPFQHEYDRWHDLHSADHHHHDAHYNHPDQWPDHFLYDHHYEDHITDDSIHERFHTNGDLRHEWYDFADAHNFYDSDTSDAIVDYEHHFRPDHHHPMINGLWNVYELEHVLTMIGKPPCPSDHRLVLADHHESPLPDCPCSVFPDSHGNIDYLWDSIGHTMCAEPVWHCPEGGCDKARVWDKDQFVIKCYEPNPEYPEHGVHDGGEATHHGCRSNMLPCMYRGLRREAPDHPSENLYTGYRKKK